MKIKDLIKSKKNLLIIAAAVVFLILVVVVISINQANVNARNSEINALLSQGQYSQAIELLKQTPEDSDKYIAIADCYINMGQLNNAQKTLQDGLGEVKYSEKKLLESKIEFIDTLIQDENKNSVSNLSIDSLCQSFNSNENYISENKDHYYRITTSVSLSKSEKSSKHFKVNSSVMYNEGKGFYSIDFDMQDSEELGNIADDSTVTIFGRLDSITYNTIYLKECKLESVQEPAIVEQTTTSITEVITEPQDTEVPVYTTAARQETIVYIAASGNGTKYHCKKNCSGMNGNVIEMTIDEARAAGYTACGRCY